MLSGSDLNKLYSVRMVENPGGNVVYGYSGEMQNNLLTKPYNYVSVIMCNLAEFGPRSLSW